jgi:hypothetical protein
MVTDRRHLWRFDVVSCDGDKLYQLRAERSSDLNRWLDALRKAGASDVRPQTSRESVTML